MNPTAPIDVAERIDAAAQLAISGRHAEAEERLRAVLEAEPGNPDALKTLAGVAIARGDGRRAYDVLASACTAYPLDAHLMANLGLAYGLLKRGAEAVACLERAVALAPEDPEIRLSLAQFLIGIGETERAIREIEIVLREAPLHVSALARLGVARLAADDADGAEQAWRRALEVDPRHSAVLHNLSTLYLASGRLSDAARLAERAHLWAPLDIDKQVHFARCLAAIGELEPAKKHCAQALAVAPDTLAAVELSARLAISSGAVRDGLDALSRYVRRRPKDCAGILALATALGAAGRAEQALAFVDQALALAPDHKAARSLRRNLLLRTGRFGEAWGGAVAALATAPPVVVAPKLTSTIDALVFGRFLPLGQHGAVTVVSMASAMATGLLRRIRGVQTHESASAAPTEAIVLQSLPAALGVEWENLRPAGKFLEADSHYVEGWRRAFAAFPRPLIGVDWDEYPPGLRANRLLPLVAGYGTVVSFAADPERRQLSAWPRTLDAGGHVGDADDLIAAMSLMDAFVGTDGLPLHVAGALAIPAFALATADAPWYLASAGENSMWYGSVKIARQTLPSAWDEPLTHAEAWLESLSNVFELPK